MRIIPLLKKYLKAGLSKVVFFFRIRQNKNSIVEFYLIDAFEISHFKPLYNILRSHGISAVFVAETNESNVTKNWFDYDRAVEILNNENLEYHTYYNKNTIIAMTTQGVEVLKKYKHSIKINMPYGIGLNYSYWGYSKKTMEGFDYKFVHGEFQKKLCSEKNIMKTDNLINIGYPRYYNKSFENINKMDIMEKYKISTTKKILVYFPTWDEDSCINAFKDGFKLLKETFFIITKPHHCTVRNLGNKDDMQIINSFSDLVLDSQFPFEDAVLLADIFVSDAKSGSSTEAILINPKVPHLYLTNRKNISDYFLPIVNNLGVIINKKEDLELIKNLNNNFIININILNQLYDISFNEEKLYIVFKQIIESCNTRNISFI